MWIVVVQADVAFLSGGKMRTGESSSTILLFK